MNVSLKSQPKSNFTNGLVFGFDLGTASIGYAVRRGVDFLDVGVLLCPEEVGDLKGRRDHRRQRRNLRNDARRRKWFGAELVKLGFPEPTDEDRRQSSLLSNPVELRCRALAGESISPCALHGAMAHLAKRRGYDETIPWAARIPESEGDQDEGDSPEDAESADDERSEEESDEKKNRKAMGLLRQELKDYAEWRKAGGYVGKIHPAQFLKYQAEVQGIWERAFKGDATLEELWEQALAEGVVFGAAPETAPTQRDKVWPRDLLEEELKAIITAQQPHHESLRGTKVVIHRKRQRPAPKQPRVICESEPRTVSITDWLLYGECVRHDTKDKEGKIVATHYVFHRATDQGALAPGMVGLRWPRFDNRGPGIDLFQPQSEVELHGKKQLFVNHVASRHRPLYREFQLEVALLNFRLQKSAGRSTKAKKQKPTIFRPDEKGRDALRKIWAEKGEILKEDLDEWIKRYEPDECVSFTAHQGHLVTKKEQSGRGRFSKLGLTALLEELRRLDAEDKLLEALKPKNDKAKNKLKTLEDKAAHYAKEIADRLQKQLRRETPQGRESQKDALDRYITEIRDPVVRHRSLLFKNELQKLIARHCPTGGVPDYIVIESTRSLRESKEDLKARADATKKHRDERRKAAQFLRDMQLPTSDKNILKFRLAEQCRWTCPYTLVSFFAADFPDLIISRLKEPGQIQDALNKVKHAWSSLEIEHIAPQADIICDEWFNLTVTTGKINRLKRKRTPVALSAEFPQTPWVNVAANAEKCFGKDSLKYRLFVSTDPNSLIDEKFRLNRTGWLARCAREISLIQCNWLTADGRDPTTTVGNDASNRFLPTMGALTQRLRRAWGLDEILHPPFDNPTDDEWKLLTDEQKEAHKKGMEDRKRKNRLDLRHHALDAMVIACTLPWYAHRIVGSKVQEGGWCELDPVTGFISRVYCPAFGDHGEGIHQAAAKAMAELKNHDPSKKCNLLRHHTPSGRNQQKFTDTLYGRRDSYKKDQPLAKPVFVARQPLTKLTPEVLKVEGNTGNLIFSESLRNQIASAWASYTNDSPNWQDLIQLHLRQLETSHPALVAAAAANRRKDKAVEASNKKMKELRAFAERTAPNGNDWLELLKALCKQLGKAGSGGPKAFFPEHFVQGLKSEPYGTPISSVKITAQTKDEDAYFETRPGSVGRAGSKTYLLQEGYEEVRIYESSKQRRGGPTFLAWFVREWIRGRKRENKKRKTFDNIDSFRPEKFRDLKYAGSIKRGDVIRLTNPIEQKTGTRLDAGSTWIVKHTEADGRIQLMPVHLANSAIDPTTGNTLNAESEKIRVSLNALMKALDYVPPHRPSTQS